MKVGIQIYTFRDVIRTVSELDIALGKLAALGFDGIEPFGGMNYAPKYVKELADKHGLLIPSTHTDPDRILRDTDYVIEEHKMLGAKYIGLPMMQGRYLGSLKGIKQFIEDYKPAAQKIAAAGLKFVYHNHHVEFERYEGKTILHHLAEGFTAEEMGFELDTYWVQLGGGDVVQHIDKLANRMEIIHFKDMIVEFGDNPWAGSPAKDCPVTTGNLNWPGIIDAVKRADISWVIVEQDGTHGQDPFEAVKVSIDNLKAKL